jgi:hypothetical protein
VTFLASAPGRNSQNSPVVITPQAYGAVSGGGDAAAAFQAAVTAAETAAASGAPVTVWIDGVFTLDNASYAAINLSRNNSGSRGWVNIVGAANAKIILSANTSRFLYLNKVADYDTFQKIRIERLEIDAGNTAGKGGVILGNVQTNGNTPTRLNFANIVVRDVKATNLYEEDTTATSQRMGIMLIGNHAAALEATQTSTTDILIEGVDVYGGAGCANVCSFGGTLVGGVNHYYNNVRFRRVRHVVATAPVNTGSQTSFFICGTGFGDYCEISDAYSKNISDDGVEIGAMQTVLLERCRLEDPFLIGVMAKNFHPAIDTARQVITCTDVIVIGTVAGRTAATDGGVRCVAFSLADDGNEYGTIRLIRPQYYLDGSSSAHALPSQKAQFFGVDTVNVRRVEIYQPKVVYNNYTDDRTGSHDTHVVYFSLQLRHPQAAGPRRRHPFRRAQRHHDVGVPDLDHPRRGARRVRHRRGRPGHPGQHLDLGVHPGRRHRARVRLHHRRPGPPAAPAHRTDRRHRRLRVLHQLDDHAHGHRRDRGVGLRVLRPDQLLRGSRDRLHAGRQGALAGQRTEGRATGGRLGHPRREPVHLPDHDRLPAADHRVRRHRLPDRGAGPWRLVLHHRPDQRHVPGPPGAPAADHVLLRADHDRGAAELTVGR